MTNTWLGYYWYKFVDQPELNQVFASLPEAERAAGECLAIPVAPGVTAEQQEEVVAAIAEVLCS